MPETPNLSEWYNVDLQPWELNRFEFRWRLLRRGTLADLPITRYVESCEWSEEEEAQTASIVLRRPGGRATLPIYRANAIEMEVRFRGKWYVVWRMQVKPKSIDAIEGQITAELQDELGRLGSHTHDYSYRRSSGHPYHAHDIAISVARQEGIPLGSIAKGTHHFRELRMTGSALDAIKAAYKLEREATGRQFVIRMQWGRLQILPLTQRNRTLYGLRDQIEAATVTEEGPEEGDTASPPTVIAARGVIGKGKGARKVTYTATNKKAVETIGYIKKSVDYKTVDSYNELREKATRALAAGLKITKTFELSHPGIPFVRRGEGIHVRLMGEQGESARERYVYVRAVSQTVEGGNYGMGLTMSSEDNFAAAAEAEREDKEQIKEKAKAEAEKKKK